MGAPGRLLAAGDADLAQLTAAFAAELRGAGLGVTPGQLARLVAAVRLLTPMTADDLYLASRPVLVTAGEQRAVFDAVFDRVFRQGVADPAEERGDTAAHLGARSSRCEDGNEAPVSRPPPPRQRPLHPAPPARPTSGTALAALGLSTGAGAHHDRDPGASKSGSIAAVPLPSRVERLARTSFAELAPGNLRELQEVFRELARALPRRRSRRQAAGGRGHEQVDLRATIARSRRTGGEQISWVRRDRCRRPRRVVFLCDISGSMRPFALAYLHWLHAAASVAHAEAFTFATRLTRLTRVLQGSSAATALARAGSAAPDWHGGTRIGAGLREFLDVHGRRGVARGAVVVVLSDGWERDDPAELAEQMARLRRLASLVVWVNPRLADPRYEPLARGMAAALPYCDAFVSGHDALAMAEVVRAIAGDSGGSPPQGGPPRVWSSPGP